MMNKLVKYTKIALLTLVLVDEVRKVTKKEIPTAHIHMDTTKITEKLDEILNRHPSIF